MPDPTPAGPARSPAVAALGLRGAGKQFGGTWVVRDVDLDLFSGQVLGLVGENGAGKSTIVKALAGIHRLDAGVILSDGEHVEFSRPSDAQSLGIEVIHQHPNLFPDLNVAENIYLAHPPRGRLGTLSARGMRQGARAVLDRLGVSISVTRPVSGLSLADQQLVEIAKALTREARVLVLDEPTAALSAHEVERLFDIVRRLRSDGVAVMLVNHRLDEVYAICDRITVLRDGRHVTTAPIDQLLPDACVRAMVGREVSMLYPSREEQQGTVALQVTGLTRQGAFDDVTFSVRRGEIVGMAGLVGAGRTEIARVIFGADRRDQGEVLLDGVPIRGRSPAVRVARGVVYVPEDRHRSGLALELSVRENLTLPLLRRLSKWSVLNRRNEEAVVRSYIDRLRIRTESASTPVGQLSGGNQQKVVISRWLAMDPTVFILDEPTQGVDIGAKTEVHRIITDLADQGLAVLLISSDLPELLGLSDRVLVVRDGRIVDELRGPEASQERVMQAALGRTEEEEGR